MRLPIINTLSSRVEVHTLFLQPTPWCARNCKGCYVKKRNPEGAQDYIHTVTPLTDQFALIKLFCKGELAWANEITVAMDDLPTSRKQQNHMVGLFDRIFGMIQESKQKRELLPSMHMTFHTVNTYLSYVDRTKNNSDWFRESKPRDTWEGLAFPGHLLDMINFSQLSANEITRKLLKKIRKETPVNYNYLIPRNVSKKNIGKHIKHLTEIGEMVDHIYLVIHKDPVGQKRTSDQIIKSQNNMANDRFYIDQMRKYLPKHIKSKINIDGCLKDVGKFIITGYGCSSNVSRFQVWPNGSVSGCAYAHPSIAKTPGLTTESILQNIKKARKRYDFIDTPCHLVADYKDSQEHLESLNLNRIGHITKEILKEIL